jgi:hypothetical protein
MENQLESIAISYDKAIDLGRKGIDLYKALPEYITNDPEYPMWKKELEDGAEGCCRKNLKIYLTIILK